MRIETTEFVGASSQVGEVLGDGRAEVAFAGRSNVGKSSLLNRLVGSRIARTSSTPGRTQTINWFRLNGRWWLVDLPGYGFARVSKSDREHWARIVEGYFDRPGARILVVQLVDARVGATVLDQEAASWFTGLGTERIVAATKIDRLKRGDRVRALEGIQRVLERGQGTELLAVSAVSGEGVRELWKRIEEFLAAG